MTVTGLLLVAFPRAGALPLRLPLCLIFVGSAALACWGGYLMLTALGNHDPSRRITELMNVTYSMQLLVGMLVFTMGTYFFAERAAQRGQTHEGNREHSSRVCRGRSRLHHAGSGELVEHVPFNGTRGR